MAEKVVVQLVLDTSRYTAGAQKAAASTGKIQSATDKTSKSVGGLQATALKAGAALGAAFAAKTVLDFAKSSIAAFSNLEESINAVAVQYGEGAEAVVALGENSAEQFGLSTRAVNEAAVAMSAFAEKIDAADPPGAFQNVLQRATDFASVMNLEVDEALRLFQSGLAGESEPLRKFGVDVSAATITAVGLAAGLGDANGKLDEGEKVQARYLAIMEQTTKVQGDFANTSESIANKQKTLNAKWEEAQVKIGKALEPAMVALLEVADNLIPVIVAVGEVVATLVSEMAPLFSLVSDLARILGFYGEESEKAADGSNDFLESIFRWKPIAGEAADAILGAAIATEEWDGAMSQTSLGLAATADAAAENALATQRGSDAYKEGIDPLTIYLGKVKEAAEAADAHNAAKRAEMDAIREAAQVQAAAVNPILGLIRAQDRQVKNDEKLVEAETGLAAERAKEIPDAEALAAAELAVHDAKLDLFDSTVDLTVAEAEAAGALEEGTAAMFELGRRAGLTDIEILDLITSLENVPELVTTDIRVRTTFSAGRGAGSQGPIEGGRQAKQHGGPVTTGQPYIVGERGPELFIPNAPGVIAPHGTFGGGGVTVNVNQPHTVDLASDLAAGLIAGQITQQVERLRN